MDQSEKKREKRRRERLFEMERDSLADSLYDVCKEHKMDNHIVPIHHEPEMECLSQIVIVDDIGVFSVADEERRKGKSREYC